MTMTVHNGFGTLRARSVREQFASEHRSPALGWSLVLLACLFPMFLLNGCSVVRQTHETVRNEHLFTSSNRRIEKQMEEWAEEAFYSHCGPDAMLLEDKHFRKGFCAGFSRYLRTGSTNEPLLPPPEYLKAKYVNWEGRDAVNRWIRGHEVGAVAAAQSGYRDLIKIPVLGVIAPDDNALPPAESVVVDAVMGGPFPHYAPVEPQPIPPSLPLEDEPAPPLTEPTPALEADPVSVPSADRNFDAFSLPIRSTQTSPDLPANTQTLSVDHPAAGGASTEGWADAPLPQIEEPGDQFAEGTLEELPDETLLILEEELPGSSDDAAELVDQTLPTLPLDETDFQWLENLPPEETLPGEDDAAWERTRADVPASLEPDIEPADPSDEELWLHPPETRQNGFGFPDSSTITVVFEEQAASPTSGVPTTQQLPAAQADKAAQRRAALYSQIANSVKPDAEHVDQCVQPAVKHQFIDESAWPDLNQIMAWPPENNAQN